MGMFDSVFGSCPHCHKIVEMQSKAGDCLCNEYDIYNVPVTIAKSLENNKTDYNTTCEHCGGRFTLKLLANIDKIPCRFVPLIDEDDDY